MNCQKCHARSAFNDGPCNDCSHKSATIETREINGVQYYALKSASATKKKKLNLTSYLYQNTVVYCKLYTDSELKERQKEWLKDASSDPLKQERIQIIQALLKPIKYKSAEAKQKAIQSFAASGLDIQFILDYAEQVKKVQGQYGHYH